MALFVFGAMVGLPWLVAVLFFVVLPVVRLLLPNDPALPPDTDRMSFRQLRWLNAVPGVQVILWIFVLPWSIFALRDMPDSQVIGFVLSMWVMMSLNLPVVHELLHSRSRHERIAARIVAGSIGYFQLLEEHKSHHTTNGVAVGDSAEIGESLYAYALKRFLRSFVVAQEWETLRQKRRGLSWRNNRIALTSLVTLAILSIFLLVAGWRGGVIYVILILGTSFSFQAITYIQHWGLTERTASDFDLTSVGYSWEDRCWLQACVTLNVAYHGHHHRRPALPYYQLAGFDKAPALPASYPVMFMAALVPPVFNSAMRRRLNAWLADNGGTARPQSRGCANISEFLSG